MIVQVSYKCRAGDSGSSGYRKWVGYVRLEDYGISGDLIITDLLALTGRQWGSKEDRRRPVSVVRLPGSCRCSRGCRDVLKVDGQNGVFSKLTLRLLSNAKRKRTMRTTLSERLSTCIVATSERRAPRPRTGWVEARACTDTPHCGGHSGHGWWRAAVKGVPARQTQRQTLRHTPQSPYFPFQLSTAKRPHTDADSRLSSGYGARTLLHLRQCDPARCVRTYWPVTSNALVMSQD